jgi:hypothetical protein
MNPPSIDEASLAKRTRLGDKYVPFTTQSAPAFGGDDRAPDRPAVVLSKQASSKEKKAKKTKTEKAVDEGSEAKSLLNLVFSHQHHNTDWDSLTVVGTCQTLEKRYFRLISVRFLSHYAFNTSPYML